MKYNVRDRSKPGMPILGTVELKNGAMPSDVLRLAQAGHLYLQPQPTESEKKQLEAHEAEKAERAKARQAAIDKEREEAEALPDGEINLNALKPRQLKAICKKHGLKTYGARETIVERLKEFFAENPEAAAEETDVVDLDQMTVAELKKIAKGYEVATSGTKEELIERIIEAADKTKEDDSE